MMKKKNEEFNGIFSAIDMKQTKYKVIYTILFMFIAFCALVVCALPVLWVLLAGFKDPAELYAVPATFFPKEIRLSKLYEAWTSLNFYKYYASTFVMALGCVVATLVVSGMAGYSMSKLKPKGNGWICKIMFLLMLVPSGMAIVPLYMTFLDFTPLHLNLMDSYWPIWLMSAASAFNIILFKNSFDGVSDSICEAARIDGASSVAIFIRIMIPLSTPVFMVVGLFAFMGSFGNFFWPYLLINDSSKTVIGVQLYKLKSTQLTVDYQMLSLLFSMIPTFVLFAIFQNKIIGGMNIGGVKG